LLAFPSSRGLVLFRLRLLGLHRFVDQAADDARDRTIFPLGAAANVPLLVLLQARNSAVNIPVSPKIFAPNKSDLQASLQSAVNANRRIR
jgi:hypothetical protein